MKTVWGDSGDSGYKVRRQRSVEVTVLVMTVYNSVG